MEKEYLGKIAIIFFFLFFSFSLISLIIGHSTILGCVGY